MKVKVSEATNTQLDWMVGKCEGINIVSSLKRHQAKPDDYILFFDSIERNNNSQDIYAPTTNWSQGGPIIDRGLIEFRKTNTGLLASYHEGATWFGPTHLVAAMRCFVASKLGEEVEIPEELK